MMEEVKNETVSTVNGDEGCPYNYCYRYCP